MTPWPRSRPSLARPRASSGSPSAGRSLTRPKADMDISPWLWLIPVGSFATLETLAILNRHQGDTFSEVLRRLTGINPRRPWRPLGVAAIVAFCTWLPAHLIHG